MAQRTFLSEQRAPVEGRSTLSRCSDWPQVSPWLRLRSLPCRGFAAQALSPFLVWPRPHPQAKQACAKGGRAICRTSPTQQN